MLDILIPTLTPKPDRQATRARVLKVLDLVSDITAAVKTAYEIHLPKAEFNYCFVAVDRVINLAHTRGTAIMELVAWDGAWTVENSIVRLRQSFMRPRPGYDARAEVRPPHTLERAGALGRAWTALLRVLLEQGKLGPEFRAEVGAFELGHPEFKVNDGAEVKPLDDDRYTEVNTFRRVYELEPRYAELATKRREGELDDAELIEVAKADAELAELFNGLLPWLYSFLSALDFNIRAQRRILLANTPQSTVNYEPPSPLELRPTQHIARRRRLISS